MAVHGRQGIGDTLLEPQPIPAVMLPASYDVPGDAVHGDGPGSPACTSSATLSKSGSSLPRRPALLKIPAQALGDKEYLTGASASKICDKEHSPAPLCRSEILGIVHDPSDVSASASHHAGTCPSPRSRHWNLAFCERFKHGLKVMHWRTTAPLGRSPTARISGISHL